VQRSKVYITRLFVLLTLSYGFLYFSYKWLDPTLHSDFIPYYKMYLKPLDFTVAPAPYIYRQINAVCVHMLWRMHVYYPNQIMFSNVHYDQHIVFAALATNYFALVGAAFLTTLLMDDRLKTYGPLPLLSGLLCFFTFQLQETLITGMSDGVSWALFAICYLFYTRKNTFWFCIAITFSILQREILPLAFVAFAFVQATTTILATRDKSVWDKRLRFYAIAGGWSALTFAGYLLFRTLVVPVDGFEGQMRLRSQLGALTHFHLTRPFVFQVLISQNLLVLFLGACWVLYRRAKEYDPMLLPIAAAWVGLFALGVISNIGNNVGRITAFLTPAIVVEMSLIVIRLQVASRHPDKCMKHVKPMPELILSPIHQ